MKILCQKNELSQAVSAVGRLASTRSTLPILQNVFLEVSNDTLLLRATDLEQTLEATIKGEAQEKGKITVPARLLIDYLANNTDQEVTLSNDDVTLLITSKNHQAKIKGIPAEEYPNLPEISTDVDITLSSEIVGQALNQTIFASAFDDTRPILTGLLFRFQEKQLTVVGTDGYRLARFTTDSTGNFTGDYILPKRALQELQRILDGETVELSFSSSQARLTVKNMSLTTRVLDGAYPPFEGIIPKKTNFEVTLNGAALLQSLKLASLFSRDSAYSTKFELEGKQLKITALSPQLGETSNTVSLTAEVKEKFAISLNAQYLIDFLQVAKGDVILGLIDAKSPILASQKDHPEYLYLLMPLRSE